MYDPTMRVLTVLELLQSRERVTGAELARRLEVSPRTVQRYVTRLQDLGVPVESTRGVGGAYRLKPGFRLPPLMFTDDEALALSLGLHALRHLGLGAFAPAAHGASAKLERVLPQTVRERVWDIETAVALESSPWTIETDASPVVQMAAAVRARQVVTMQYRSHDRTESSRQLEPYGVVHVDGRWYAVGRCRLREALRSFRLDRVIHIELLPETFERPEEFDARAYLLASLPFVHAPYTIKVSLDLPIEMVRGRTPPSRVVLEPEGHGTLLRCSREDLEPFATMLLSLGCALVVHEPPELRAVFRTLAERATRAARED